MDTKTQNPAPCWFMSNPFSSGMVYRQLEKTDFEYVVGMDFGHGESLVALYRKRDGTVTLLNLDATHATKIPTYIRVDSRRNVLIGNRAKRGLGFIQHFKASPAQWNEKKQGYTYATLMANYIRTLWEQAVSLCDELRSAPADKVMIVVGCPASPVWTNTNALRQYRDLIRAATRYPNVSILPESTAAIMSVIHSADGVKGGQRLMLDRGLAVVDAGSSTLDFTYVILGKQLITRSVKLGGSELDLQMRELVLEQNGITEDQIPQEQYPEIMVQLRVAKEQFYPDREPIQITIPIWGRNPDGSGNRELDSGLALKCSINQDFMTKALNRPAIEPEGVVGGEMKSWLDTARDFILSTRDLIPRDGQGNLICDHVLVTGGTSFVTELMDQVKGAYGRTLPVQSQDPSSSVAKGLAHAKQLDIQGHGLVEQYREEIRTICARHYDALLEDLCRFMVDTSCEISRDVCIQLSKTPGKKKVSYIMDTIYNAAGQDPRLSGPDYKARVQELFQKHFLAAYDELREKANEVSASMYGANLQNSLPMIPPLTQRDLHAIVSKLDLKTFVSKAMLDPVVSGSIFTLVQYLLTYVAFELMKLGQVWAGIISGLIGFLLGMRSIQELIQKTIFKLPFVTFSNNKLLSFAGELSDAEYREKIVSKISADTVRDIRKAVREKERIESKENRRLRDPRPMYKEFSTCLSVQAEAILGKLLFLVYDEKPDAGEE